jgi:GNAT superfamily N-acetyltransferase
MTAPASPGSDAVEIRDAVGAERQACRMLLPEWASAMGWSRMLVAVGSASGRIQGAAMAMPLHHASGETHLRFIARVARPYRGRGVGSAVLDHLSVIARAHGMPALVAIGVDEDAAAFLERVGFRGSDLLLTHKLDLGAVMRRTTPIAARADRTGRVPTGTRTVPIDPDAVRRLARLHGALIGGNPDAIAETMHARLHDRSWSQSRMMVIDGEPCAFMSARTSGEVFHIEACLVAPSLQAGAGGSGWAAPWLLAEMCKVAHEAGVTTLHFECRDTNRPMIALANAMRATPTGRKAVMLRRLD